MKRAMGMNLVCRSLQWTILHVLVVFVSLILIALTSSPPGSPGLRASALASVEAQGKTSACIQRCTDWLYGSSKRGLFMFKLLHLRALEKTIKKKLKEKESETQED